MPCPSTLPPGGQYEFRCIPLPALLTHKVPGQKRGAYLGCSGCTATQVAARRPETRTKDAHKGATQLRPRPKQKPVGCPTNCPSAWSGNPVAKPVPHQSLNKQSECGSTIHQTLNYLATTNLTHAPTLSWTHKGPGRRAQSHQINGESPDSSVRLAGQGNPTFLLVPTEGACGNYLGRGKKVQTIFHVQNRSFTLR